MNEEMPRLIPAFPRPLGTTGETAASRTYGGSTRMNKHGRGETVPTSELDFHRLGRKRDVPQIVFMWSARLFPNASFFPAFEATVYIPFLCVCLLTS